VKTDFSLGSFRLEIRGGIANRQCHDKPPNARSMIVRALNIGAQAGAEQGLAQRASSHRLVLVLKDKRSRAAIPLKEFSVHGVGL
jgi:hypothetical protein